MLCSFADFEEFKQLMLSYRAEQTENGDWPGFIFIFFYICTFIYIYCVYWDWKGGKSM